MTTVRPRPRAPQPPRPDAAETRARANPRLVAFVALLAVYAVYSVLVIVPSWVGEFDQYLYAWHIKRDILTHGEYRTIYWYLVVGQRAPVLLAFLPYFLWISWHRRSITPITAFLSAQLLLNLSVGAVKLAIGRIGPKETTDVYQVFVGGNIYPSGHVSNAVVIWGLMAFLVTPRLRPLWTGIAIWVSLSVGVGTVAINTHWFSDVVGGWFAGGLVLLVLPWIVPAADRAVMRGYDRFAPRVLPRRLRDAVDARRSSRTQQPSDVERLDPGQFDGARP